ncbi:uncharacterized protein PSFLO_06870 [Pseudozyma flocculosa]|uniref:Uncharacterized protein n=1 Tax=Pseudozyma flocculosa TaxID=84751 RepID=A0A5C3FA95_9BASI|nr:uncharacterized protein PSFLO_06870 [Pseudozyma flocculosa]
MPSFRRQQRLRERRKRAQLRELRRIAAERERAAEEQEAKRRATFYRALKKVAAECLPKSTADLVSLMDFISTRRDALGYLEIAVKMASAACKAYGVFQNALDEPQQMDNRPAAEPQQQDNRTAAAAAAAAAAPEPQQDNRPAAAAAAAAP